MKHFKLRLSVLNWSRLATYRRLGGSIIVSVGLVVVSTLAISLVYSIWMDTLTTNATVSIADLSPVNADITITPQSLNADSSGSPLEAQISFGRGRCSHTGVHFDSITLRVYAGNYVVWPDREITRNKSKLIVRFDRQAVINLIGNHPGGEVTFELRGEGDYACEFAGTDTIGFLPVEVESESIGVQSDGSGATDETQVVSETNEPTDESGSDQPSTDDDAGTESSTEDGGTTGESEPDSPESSEPESTDSP